MRTVVAVLVLATALSGCIQAGAAVDAEEIDPYDDLRRILVRGFLDEDHVFHVRLGAVNALNGIVPFDGFVWVTLEPGEEPGEEKKEWIARIWTQEVWKGGFSKDTPLPYWEFTVDATWLDYGEPIILHARAELTDGKVIEGIRESYA